MNLPAQKIDILGSEEELGWRGELELGFTAQGKQTVLKKRRSVGPLVVQRPFYPEGGLCHLYILHPPGGVVGGDKLKLSVDINPKAQALLTTPGATKFYRSTGAWAKQTQTLNVEEGGSLEWFPHENIVFNGSKSSITTRVNLQGDANFMGWEILCLGRPAAEERFVSGECRLCLEIWREDRPLLIERLRIAEEEKLLTKISGMQSEPITASFVATLYGQKLDDELGALDCLYEDALVASTVVDGLLVCRYLGKHAEQAKNYFQRVWQVLRPKLLERPACMPRIWQT